MVEVHTTFFAGRHVHCECPFCGEYHEIELNKKIAEWLAGPGGTFAGVGGPVFSPCNGEEFFLNVWNIGMMPPEVDDRAYQGIPGRENRTRREDAGAYTLECLQDVGEEEPPHGGG